MAIQEDILNLEVMESKFGRKINARFNSLKDDLMFLKQKEVDIDALLTLKLDTDKDELIEVVLSDMRIHTNLFRADLNKD